MTVPFLSVKPRALKLKVVPKFPAGLLGGSGIDVSKANGNYTIDLDYSDFAQVGSLPASSYALVYNPAVQSYVLVPTSLMGGGGGGIPDAPSDSKTYGRSNAAWSQALPIAGGTLTGTLVLNADPAVALGAATKQYVDAHVGGANPVATIAALRALTVPAHNTPVYLQGYSGSGDGGEGWFVYNSGSAAVDNGGTVIAPTVGAGRWLRSFNGSNINVRWFGLRGDNTTESMTQLNAALAAAVALRGGLYFPATTQRYLLPSALIVPDNTAGLHIFGDAAGTPVGGTGVGSCIATTAATAIDMTGTALGGTGSISNIIVENLQLYATGTGGKALKMWNVAWSQLKNLIIAATQGVALDMAGSANIQSDNVQLYTQGGFAPTLRFSQDAVGSQNVGPLVWNAGQISAAGGAFPTISISGDPLGVVFNAMLYSWSGTTGTAAITLDGPTSGTPVGSVEFINCHGESNYNTTNTGADILVGNAHKFGTVIIDGGNFWGHGNGTNYQRDFLQVVAARNVIVRGVTASKLAAANGYSRSMVRLETTFPTAGDLYSFADLISDISGSMYSDASGVVTGTGDKTNIAKSNVAAEAAASFNGLGITPTSGASLSIAGGVAVSGPAASGTLTTRTSTDTLTNKTIDTAGPNTIKVAGVDLSGAWTAYTPSASSQTAGATFTSVAGRYLQMGKTVFVQMSASVSAVNAGAGAILLGLPVPLKAGFNGGLSGATASGLTIGAILNQGNFGNSAALLKYDSTTLLANGQLVSVSGVFEAN